MKRKVNEGLYTWVPNSEWYNGLLEKTEEIRCVHCIVDDDQVIKLCIYQLDIIDTRYRTIHIQEMKKYLEKA